MLNCAIVDDEPLAQEILAGYMASLDRVQLVGRFSNAFDARAFLEDHTVDVLFLDIEMPEMSGIDFLKSLPHPPITVFTTAFRDYAFEGFELGVIDFLLKPIAKPRFLLALEKIRDFLSLKTEDADFELSRDTPEFIFVKSGVRQIKLFFADVTHIQGLKDYAIIYAASGKIVVKGSIKFMQKLFPSPRFIRVHKSFLVAMDKIKRIEKNRIIIGDHQIPIGRNYKDEMGKKCQARS
ncbi:LytR/AlgR family response regulator transcription factor [Parapedobacter koreensis]|uniref:Two component transcriptional regulator, LytTR family n=1 Tax=Parapedobacter koreensis TaxID=332977 RepID=A0A1H7NTC4_9SPHI|nr:LytTR family DNA-binding domain-containing protein [Parapedobacter koreensis]SEL26656.1 two component transcriptional regulator, LytTR family [Parapedobacter koreensis]